MVELNWDSVNRDLEEIIKSVSWADVLLGEHKDDFLKSYLALRSQLKEGDRFVMEFGIMESEKPGERSYPYLRTVLHTSDGKKRVIQTAHHDGFFAPFNTRLYQ